MATIATITERNIPNNNNPGGVDPEVTLKGALESLENELQTPLVSGEHTEWTRGVTEAWHAAAVAAHDQIAAHRKQFKEMMNVDQEIFRQVELLKKEDEELEKHLDCVGKKIYSITRKTPVAERDELRTEQDRQTLVADGIAFINRMRKQEIAIKTWFGEAFNRDRGPVD
jgi:hypothetical protein